MHLSSAAVVARVHCCTLSYSVVVGCHGDSVVAVDRELQGMRTFSASSGRCRCSRCRPIDTTCYDL